MVAKTEIDTPTAATVTVTAVISGLNYFDRCQRSVTSKTSPSVGDWLSLAVGESCGLSLTIRVNGELASPAG